MIYNGHCYGLFRERVVCDLECVLIPLSQCVMNESLQLLSTSVQSQLYEVYGLLQRAKTVSGVLQFRVPLILWILYKKVLCST